MDKLRPAWVDWLILSLFATTIGAPLLYTLTTVTQQVLAEEEVSAGTLAKDIVRKSHSTVNHPAFGAQLMVSPVNYGFVKYLNYSPNPNLFIGPDGWMFYLRPETGLAYYRCAQPLTADELQQWYTFLRNRRDWCRERGVHYLMVVAPNKSSIYSHYVPPRLKPCHDATRMDQLMANLPEDLTEHFLDLRPALREASADNDVFLKADSHWNDRGAYVAYKQILQSLSKQRAGEWSAPVSIKRIEDELSGEGDFAHLLKCKALCLESRPKFAIVPQAEAEELPFDDESVDTLTPTEDWPWFATHRTFQQISRDDLPRAVVFRDSFTCAMIPYLAENFQRVTFLWQPNFIATEKMLNVLDTRHIATEQPDFVIEEVVERYMAYAPPAVDVDIDYAAPQPPTLATR